MGKLYKLKNQLQIAIYKFFFTVMNTSDYAMWQQDEYGTGFIQMKKEIQLQDKDIMHIVMWIFKDNYF